MNESESRGDRAAEGCQRSAGASGACWRLPLLLAVVLAAIVIVNGRGVRRERAGTGTAAPAISADGENQKTVSLVIDLPAGARSSNGIPWREGMTVADLLAAAETIEWFKEMRFAQQGTGESAFLTTLGGVANEGAGGRNWTYRVNGQRGDRSFAVYKLQPGDQVLWTFGEIR